MSIDLKGLNIILSESGYQASILNCNLRKNYWLLPCLPLKSFYWKCYLILIKKISFKQIECNVTLYNSLCGALLPPNLLCSLEAFLKTFVAGLGNLHLLSGLYWFLHRQKHGQDTYYIELKINFDNFAHAVLLPSSASTSTKLGWG